jgi:hypothetical protein
MTYGTIGTVSAGTMRNEDLIPAFTDVLDELRDPDNQFHAALVKETNELIKNDLEDAEMLWSPDVLDWFRAKLSDALNEYAPPYSYFGSHPGDGADYGYWVDMDYLSEDARWDIPLATLTVLNDEYRIVNDDYIVHANDHGNVTLYEIDRSGPDVTTGAEIWSLV